MEHKPIVKAMEETHNKLNRGRSYFGMGYVDSYDLLETLITDTKYELEKLEETKKVGIKFWSDTQFMRYNESKYHKKQLIEKLEFLYREAEKSEAIYDQAREGSAERVGDPPF